MNKIILDPQRDLEMLGALNPLTGDAYWIEVYRCLALLEAYIHRVKELEADISAAYLLRDEAIKRAEKFEVEAKL